VSSQQGASLIATGSEARAAGLIDRRHEGFFKRAVDPTDDSGRENPVRVDICVITCLRPGGLRRLLRGLAQLRLPDPAPELRVVVVDNDAEGSARELCAEAARWLAYPLCYRTEKRRGIPQARNAAIAASLGEADFVAFIDDDEVPDPEWLAELLRTQAAHAADAVTGPVDPAFEAPVPRWIEESALFARRQHATGTPVPCAYTGNVLVSTRSLAAMDEHFDERMALTGGSDREFFERFAGRGHQIVWCESAVAREWVPASRARLGWLLRRAMRVGTTATLIDRLRSGRGSDAVWIAAHAGWCITKGILLAACGLPRGRASAARGLYLACFGAGRLAGIGGWAYQEYRTIHGG
jgi:hypothetical protein